MTPAPLLMSMRDIAELAGVQRPAVTTWRKRHGDFPAPAGGDAARPLFDPGQVAEWLIATARADRAELLADLSVHTLASLGQALAPRDLLAVVTALICLRHLEADEPLADGSDDVLESLWRRAVVSDPDDDLLFSEIAAMTPETTWIAHMVDDLVEASWGCRGAYERVMTARQRLRAADLTVSAVSPQLAELIVGLSGAAELAARQQGPIIVADPAAGCGDLLTAVAERLGADMAPVCAAAEPDPFLARLARRRLTVHGLDLHDFDVRVAADLPDDAGDPDVIVSQIPYQPAEERSAEAILDRIGDVMVRLDRGSSAVILGPADVLVGELPAFSPAERMRARLVGDDAVEGVIRLPGGLVPFRPGYETALWVLHKPAESHWPGRLLIADVSDRDLTDQVVADLIEDVVTWRREGFRPEVRQRIFAVQAERPTLMDPPGALSVTPPRDPRTVDAEAADSLTRILALEIALDKAAAAATEMRPSIRSNAVADVRTRPAAKSIGRLVREGLLVIRPGVRIHLEHIRADGHLVYGTDEVLGVRRSGDRAVDRLDFAASYPRAKLTRPGDILVTLAPEFGVLVDEQGYSVTEFPVRVLRLTDDGLGMFTPRVLAAMLGQDGGNRRPFGAIRQSRRLEDRLVPVLPPDEVTRLDALLTSLAAWQRQAELEIDMLGELGVLLTAGLRDGTLALAGDAR